MRLLGSIASSQLLKFGHNAGNVGRDSLTELIDCDQYLVTFLVLEQLERS